MKLVRSKAELRSAVAELRTGGRSIAFVPTMGYLHDGHLSLLDRAAELADATVLSIFVNPLQFAPTEDLSKYPRQLERDMAMAEKRGTHLVFAPGDDEMYPDGEPAIRVVPARMADRMCGAFRPGHFEGVLTVVAKLFNLVQPDVALFGQKDFQQATLIRRMVDDLDMPVRIEFGPIIRESDGLAMSSRNVYLKGADRQRALALSRGLFAARAAFDEGERSPARLSAIVAEHLAKEGVEAQYIELAHPLTLEPVDVVERGTVLAIAAYIGTTRLIDNVVLGDDA